MPSSSPAEWLLKRILIGGVLLLALSLAIFLPLSRRTTSTPAPVSPSPTLPLSPSVSLTIHFPDNHDLRWTNLSLAPDATLLDIMTAAKSHPHPLHFEFKGSGDTAFLTSLEGLVNESASSGPPGSTRFWQYWINDRYATVGFGAAKLTPGDRVTWVFEPFSDNPRPPTP